MKNAVGWIIIAGFIFIVAFFMGLIIRQGVDYRLGYIDCLLDMQNNRSAKYVLKTQGNGETVWIKNTEEQSK